MWRPSRPGGSILLPLALLTAGCGDLLTALGQGQDAGPTSSSDGSSSGDGGSSSSSSSSSSGGGGATSGTNCGTDPSTGITLCEGIDLCPGLIVDQGAFPGCGFRLNAASPYDLECDCGDFLCPIGAPPSCAAAAQLLDQEQSSLNVCQQQNEGTCLSLAPTGGGTQSTCDKSCESECAGDPNCIQMCGC